MHFERQALVELMFSVNVVDTEQIETLDPVTRWDAVPRIAKIGRPDGFQE